MKSKFQPPLAPGQVMKRTPRSVQKADEDKFLLEDIVAIIEDRMQERDAPGSKEKAALIITVVRERVLQEIAAYARMNIRR